MMNVHQTVLVSLVVTAFGQPGGAACGGEVGTTGARGISTDAGGAMDVTSASSTGGSGGDSGDGEGLTGYDGPTRCGSAAVSFSADLMPIFQRSCTLSSVCHGQMGNSGEENLYLGLNAGGGGTADSQAVYSGLVGVPSKEDPSMNLVTKGDVQNSFLWHKVNDDQVTLNSGTLATGCREAITPCADCTTTMPCGGTQPYLAEWLGTSAPGDLCTIESWISQGAPNN